MAIFTDKCRDGDCSYHFHAEDPILENGESGQQSQTQSLKQRNTSSDGEMPKPLISPNNGNADADGKQAIGPLHRSDERGLRRIIKNFTPS